jgi:cation diffusion facilitator family transporter
MPAKTTAKDGSGEHYRKIRGVLLIVLALNWGVAAAKIILGFFTRCQSMTADGFHSLADGSSNIIGLIGITLSSQPVDADHPYGHKKYETFFSLGIAALLILVAVNLFKGGAARLFHPVSPQADMRSFVVMTVTMLVNIRVMRYEYSRGKGLKSDILIADSMHTRADIFTSISVIVALVAIKLGYPIVDPVVTVVISGFIAYAAYRIIKEASRILCDTMAIEDVKKVTRLVMCVKGVRACHKIRARGRPDDICIDLHVQVDSDMHIDESHKICYAIEDALKAGIPDVTDVLVHIEPKVKKRKK